MSNRSLYLRFMGLANAVQKGAGADIDPIALKLLEAITDGYEQGKLLRVSDVLELNELASYATLHKKLEQLKRNNWVAVKCMVGDHRSRYLTPTKVTLKYFDNLGKALIKVGQNDC